MISGIIGKVKKKENGRVFIETRCGLIYEINVNFRDFSKIDGEIELLVVIVKKDDSDEIYGFLDEIEKELFKKLIKISGVGPKIALAILSTFTISEFESIVANEDIALLKRVPGIGQKMAKRILVEFSSFSFKASKQNEVIIALEGLGFKRENILKVIDKLKAKTIEEKIKEALKLLAKV